jgi:hypothetical protein
VLADVSSTAEAKMVVQPPLTVNPPQHGVSSTRSSIMSPNSPMSSSNAASPHTSMLRSPAVASEARRAAKSRLSSHAGSATLPQMASSLHSGAAGSAGNVACCDCATESCPCLQRVCSHSYFFVVCCGYVLVSSLPRIFCVVDLSISLIMFLVANKGNFDLHVSLGDNLYNDVFHYQ